jgi:predicted nuclease of restriction endonuclease-like (RecB) superfamily
MLNSKDKQPLHSKVRELIIEARSAISRTVNFVSVVQNWEIGRMIVEEEQGGEAKAEYGKYIIKELSKKLTEEFGSSYNTSNLKRYRQFYLTFPISAALRHQLETLDNKGDTKSAALWHRSSSEIIKAVQLKSHPLFQIISPYLSWSHYKSLITVENPKAREFYMKGAVENGWGTRALDRQINSLYYERLLSSQDKKPVIDEMKEKTTALQPEDIFKDPYILEFLQLKENKKYLETELEQALIDKMNDFLLELGKGFAFVARQKRISTETKHFYIDLVFYNYLLKCFVLIDLKTGELTHQDIGQMDMYVRLYEDKYKPEGDNPTIGIILCTENDHTIVKYSVLNENKQLFASKYKVYLPTEEELRRELEQQKQQIQSEIKQKSNDK